MPRPSKTLAPGTLDQQVGGWTLIEMLVALALMATLAALALPTYQQQQRNARRSDGQAALQQLQIDQTLWRANHARFADDLAMLGWPSALSPQGHYEITVAQADEAGFTALASPRGTQAADTDCSPLRLRSQGNANAVFSGGPQTDSGSDRCWRR